MLFATATLALEKFGYPQITQLQQNKNDLIPAENEI
jgi:hypothetical protein